MKKLAIILLLLAALQGLQWWTGLEIPLAKWLEVSAKAVGGLIFTLTATTIALFTPSKIEPETARAMAKQAEYWQEFWTGTFAQWAANGIGLLCLLAGVLLLVRGPQMQWTPLTIKRWNRFRSIRRGYISLWLLAGLVLLALLDSLLVGKRALLVKYDGKLRAPFLEKNPIMGSAFGAEPANSETNYRTLKLQFAEKNQGNWVLMPLVPYDSRGDTEPVLQTVEKRADGLYYDIDSDSPFTGGAFKSYKANPEMRRLTVSFFEGKLNGQAAYMDPQGNLLERVVYEKGEEKSRKELAPHPRAEFDTLANPAFQRIDFAPTAPSVRHQHFLGTDSSGADVLAQLVGAFQLVIGASIFFLIIIYTLGVVIGGLMGYLGGWVDLLSQRGIEIWASLPFLYIVILFRSLNERPSLLFVVTALAAFSWMGIAAYMRTATFREKNRDYVAASKLLGAGNSRMIFTHILPNVLSILITLLPFEVDAVVVGLTSLDYLGFGLPVGEPSWGVLLKDGTANLDKPWILISAFSALATVLVLVTFVGEAVREAFDPRKFSYYS